MNVQSSENMGAYLRQFLRALNRRAAVDGPDAFAVEILDEGFDEGDLDLLQ